MSDWHTETAQPYKRLYDCLPTLADADCNGDVLFLRSGTAMLGRVASGVPIDATHWRHTRLYDYSEHIKDTT